MPLLEEIEQKPDAEPEFDDGRLIPDVAVPFAEMKRVNASVVADITEFRRGKLQLAEMTIEAHLRDGSLDLRTLDFRTLKGQLLARGTLSPDGESGTASLQAVARDFAPGLREANVDLSMTTDLDLDVKSTGADLRTLAGNANGVIYVDTRGGRLKIAEMITAIYGNMLEEMLNTMNPLREKDPYTDLECLVMPLTIDDGKLAGAPSIFVSTAKIRAVTQGSLDLKTEKIRVGVRTTPRKIVSFSAAE
nr:AsmA-like C-terminal region-containing protein [Desulfuromonadales bacterium]